MEILYKGTKYTRELRNNDNTAFAQAPYVVLHQKASNQYYAASSITDISSAAKKEFQFTFSAALTKTMLTGVYNIEVYKDSSMEEMLHYQEEYCKAVETAASLAEEESEESSEESSN